MANKRPSIAAQRLAHVRAIKDEYFHEELTIEERLRLKDERIAELERELDILRARLRNRVEAESGGPRSSAMDGSQD